MRHITIILIVICNINAGENPVMKETGFPIVVEIPCTDINQRMTIIEGQKLLLEYVAKYGYIKQEPNGAESYFGPISYVTENQQYPKYISISQGKSSAAGDYKSIFITTKGATVDGKYTGHSDEFTFELAGYLSKFINITRVKGKGLDVDVKE